jgi:ATP-binding cassette subfamily F protein 3
MALQEYEGAMVLVSHDRHLLRSVTDQFLLVDDGKVSAFNDDLDAYRSWLMQPKQIETNKDQADDADKGINKKVQRQQLAEQRKRLNPLKKEVVVLEQKMTTLSQEMESIEVELAQPEIYQAENRADLEALSVRRGKLSAQLEDIEEHWLEKSEALEALSKLE